ncbi:MAG: transposase [Dehalococcoidia bacterium]|jgi:REP element-mobilizing transposase RayT|nr:transposase [Dehalococcoidia bacterium]
MTYNPDVHRRRSLRLPGYDYRGSGGYFVTICAQDRACLFGEIVGDRMQLNGAGLMVHTAWNELPAFYPSVGIDGFVVMPNHLHGIINRPDDIHDVTLSLGDVVQRFKTITTTRYITGVRRSGWQRFRGRLWQRNYYEHVVRDDDDRNRIRRYIHENPLRWSLDPANPGAPIL